MSVNREVKYAVCELDCVNFDMKIIDVFCDFNCALAFMHGVIDDNETYENSYYYKKYSDNKNMVSIYKCGYTYGKSLIFRYFIKEYTNTIYYD